MPFHPLFLASLRHETSSPGVPAPQACTVCWIAASVITPTLWALSFDIFSQKVPQHSMWQNSYTHPIRSGPILRVTSLNHGVWVNGKGNLDWTSPCICPHTTQEYMSINFIAPLYYYLLYSYSTKIFPGDRKDICIFSWDTAPPGGQGHIPQKQDI